MPSAISRDRKITWVILALFAAVVALLGGSARPDAVQIVALRPLAAIFLIPALIFLTREQVSAARTLLLLLALTVIWMVIQLIPLPPVLWHNLPGRDVVAEMDALIGLADVWRPIAWVPSRGWNALASLIVPLAAMLLAIGLGAKRADLLMLIVGMAVIDAMLNIVQSLQLGGELLYWYAITNKGSPVGLFANENHSAIFSAMGLLVAGRLFAESTGRGEAQLNRIICATGCFVIFLGAIVSGSRSGLVLAALASVASLVLIWQAWLAKPKKRSDSWFEKQLRKSPKLTLISAGMLGLALLVAFFMLDRLPALDGFLRQNAFEDLRWKIWPTLQTMMATHFWLGAGFGSFEELYHIYEPTSLLGPEYINQAHNDWAQLIIEGGIPAFSLLIGLFVWVSRAVYRVHQSNSNDAIAPVFWAAIACILAVASFADYPLRTPIFQAAIVWLLLSLALDRHEP